MVDQRRVTRCRDRLIKVARAEGKITYSALAEFLGVANQSVGLYLNAVYEQEIAAGHPDLTVVVVYADTDMGRYNSRGGPAQSVRVNPDNSADVQAYKDELNRVYKEWS
jgi:DNA-binding XRE family transcriptional regulator